MILADTPEDLLFGYRLCDPLLPPSIDSVYRRIVWVQLPIHILRILLRLWCYELNLGFVFTVYESSSQQRHSLEWLTVQLDCLGMNGIQNIPSPAIVVKIYELHQKCPLVPGYKEARRLWKIPWSIGTTIFLKRSKTTKYYLTQSPATMAQILHKSPRGNMDSNMKDPSNTYGFKSPMYSMNLTPATNLLFSEYQLDSYPGQLVPLPTQVLAESPDGPPLELSQTNINTNGILTGFDSVMGPPFGLSVPVNRKRKLDCISLSDEIDGPTNHEYNELGEDLRCQKKTAKLKTKAPCVPRNTESFACPFYKHDLVVHGQPSKTWNLSCRASGWTIPRLKYGITSLSP